MIDLFFNEVNGRYRQERLLHEAEVARMLRAARRSQRSGTRLAVQTPGWAAVRWGLAAAGGLLVAAGTWLQRVSLPALTETDYEPLTT